MVESQDVSVERRVYGMAQYLLWCEENGMAAEGAALRDVVDKQAALDAVLQIAAVIDEHVQSGAIPAGRGLHAGAMLMLIRDYLEPLPPGISADGRDRLTEDLHELAGVLASVRDSDANHV